MIFINSISNPFIKTFASVSISVGYGIFGNGKNDLHEDHLKIQSTSLEQKLSKCAFTLFSSDSEQKLCLKLRENGRGLPNWHPLKGNRVKITS